MKNSDMPAMPLDSVAESDVSQGYEYECAGLTKREHFAGLAMQGLLSNPKIISHMLQNGDDLETFTNINISNSALARADALLQELEK